MIFKIYNCDFGMKINGTDYKFTDVNSITIVDPEKNKLTRGANSQNELGLVYKEGMKEAKSWTLPILNMSAALKAVLDSAFKNQSRIDLYCIDTVSGSSKMAKNAILCNKPQQLTIDDTAESLQVSLEFETFNSSENHKDVE